MRRRSFMSSAIAIAATGALGRLYGCSVKETSDLAKLSEHTITSIETTSVKFDYPRLVGRNARLGLHGTGPTYQFRIIKTDQGASGWAESKQSEKEVSQLKKLIMGKRLDEVFDPARGILDLSLKPYDLALHDLAGRILDKPVYKMMGEEGSIFNDCYSGMIYFDDIEPLDNPPGIKKVLSNCQYDYDKGYRQFKIKIGRGNKWMEAEAGLQRDIEVTGAIHEQFPDVTLLVDGNNGFTPDTFIKYLEGIDDVPLMWIEEPFQESREGLEKLKAFLTKHNKDTYIAEGEAGFDKDFLLDLAADKLVDVFIPDIRSYGFTMWRNMMPELKKLGILTSPHAWGSPAKTNYTAHLATGMGNVLTIEGVTGTSKDLELSGYSLVDGKIKTCSKPGFGMDLLNLK
jgi:L-alanine-DL-glutamate epimerase-like enolase superfamily enzyme